MKPRHAFMIALLLGIGAYILIQRTWTPNVSVNNTPVAQTVQTASSNNQADNPSPTPAPSEEKIYLSDGLRLETTTINKRSANGEFSVDIQYPQLVRDGGGKDALVQNFNNAIRQLIHRETGWAYEVKRDGGFLNAGYEVSYASDELISIKFSMCSICCGAATAGCNAFVLNYDLRRNKKLNPNDLFKPRSAYVKTLMSYCEPEIRRRYGSLNLDVLPVSERAKEYKQFGITPQGLNVMFDEYAVAAGSDGIVNVLVPFDAIKDKINPRSPLAKLAGVANE